MATKTLATHLADILTGKRESTAEELRRAKLDAHARLDDIDKRQRMIGDGGKVRRDVEMKGLPGDLVALDGEMAELEAERKQLRARAKELHRQSQLAQVREAEANHKANSRALDKALDAMEAAHAEYRAKVADAEAIVNKAHNARTTAGQVDPTAADSITFARSQLERLARHVYAGDDRQARSSQMEYVRSRTAPDAAPSRPRGPAPQPKGAQA